ncbi:MAG: 4Fe-4S binding protein [Treponema sp.]|jgi:dihydroorotate dehydrogenase (fumarate)|nr:4Fe-4S binding protein [Treponema sp.]
MDMRVNYGGLKLKHPIIAASAGTTMDYKEAVKCDEAGYSAVVLKSVQEEELMRYNPFPRFKILRSGIPGFSSTTFYSYEQAYYGDIDAYAKTVYESKKRISVPLIASINCITPEAWPKYAEACEQAGADAIEFVPSCPTGQLIRDSTNDIRRISLAALEACGKAVKIPVIPKMTGQVADVAAYALDLARGGAGGLTMINRATGLDIDVETMAPILHGGFAGHGGSWALHSTLRWLVSVYPHIEIPISATGGITNGEETIKSLLAGANTVQIAAVMYLKGYDYVKIMLREIEDYMERKSIPVLSSIIGVGAKNTKSMKEYDRVTRWYARGKSENCKKCSQCRAVCIYGALSYEDKKGPHFDRELCDGCGLCAGVCQFNAIEMLKKN